MIDKTILIMGYGRAGKRQAALAKGFGLAVDIYDPLYPDPGDLDGYTNRGDYYDYEVEGKTLGDYDYVVICTPPRFHLGQIKDCLEAGVKAILCEKPLCAIGQLDEAKTLPPDAPVMVAYNYRYHPGLLSQQGTFIKNIQMYCKQYRIDLPDWGLLLDHCSHDLDIVRMMSKSEIKINDARRQRLTISYHMAITDTCSMSENTEQWQLYFSNGTITEIVSDKKVTRAARILGLSTISNSTIEIDPSPTMFSAMWQAFLAGDYYPDLAEAIKTQELLEQCYRLNEERTQ